MPQVRQQDVNAGEKLHRRTGAKVHHRSVNLVALHERIRRKGYFSQKTLSVKRGHTAK
jgi:hypothetical protein